MVISSCSFLSANIASPTPEIETVEQFFARCPTVEEIKHVDADLRVSFELDPTMEAFDCEFNSRGLARCGKSDPPDPLLQRNLRRARANFDSIIHMRTHLKSFFRMAFLGKVVLESD
jgi:hypothetical protein